MRVQTSLDDIREAAREHGARLSDMEDWELLAVLDAKGMAGAYLKDEAGRAAEAWREPLGAMLAQGYSNTGIAREWNDRGELGPRGGLWTATAIRRLRQRLHL